MIVYGWIDIDQTPALLLLEIVRLKECEMRVLLHSVDWFSVEADLSGSALAAERYDSGDMPDQHMTVN